MRNPSLLLESVGVSLAFNGEFPSPKFRVTSHDRLAGGLPVPVSLWPRQPDVLQGFAQARLEFFRVFGCRVSLADCQ